VDPEGIDNQGNGILAISFDDGQDMAIDGKLKAGVARHPDDAEAIPLATSHTDNRERNRGTVGIASFTIDQCVGCWNPDCSTSRNMVPTSVERLSVESKYGTDQSASVIIVDSEREIQYGFENTILSYIPSSMSYRCLCGSTGSYKMKAPRSPSQYCVAVEV